MTISARNWAWDSQRVRIAGVWRDLHPGEKLTLLCLAEDENAEEGYAFRSQENIAARTGQNGRTVRRHIGVFVEAGALRVEKRRRRSGKWANSVYVLNVPEKYRATDPEWQRHQPEGTVSFGWSEKAS